jgi:hypothetical protein
MVLAHTDSTVNGTPKNYCEDQNEWHIHDYGPPDGGNMRASYINGNIVGDCFGEGGACLDTLRQEPTAYDPEECADAYPHASDFHKEFALGGAIFPSEEGIGEPSPNPNDPAGSLFCYDELGHHTTYGTVFVYDNVLPSGVRFTVATDTVDLTGQGEGCGDLLFDDSVECVDSCTIPTSLPLGLDGSRHVIVTGTAGHVVLAN